MVDIVGYRKHGHNEIDEPMFTQPIMYSIVRKHKDVMQLYSKKLQDEGMNYLLYQKADDLKMLRRAFMVSDILIFH